MTNRRRRLLHLLACILLGGALILFGFFLYLNPQISPITRFRDVQLQTPLRIYSQEGLLIAEYGNRRRIPVPLKSIPRAYINATLDVEDKRFYRHSGVDFISLLNASRRLMISGRIQGGASTITMQVARNLSLNRRQTFIRKFKEILLSLKLERELTKDEILELYINLIPFGKRAYGVEAAAQTYYGKSSQELNLAQIAMLAGIPQAPTAGNPVNNPKRALRRRNLVLLRMRNQSSITEEEYKIAIAMPVTAKLHSLKGEVSAPWFAEEIRRQMLQKHGPVVYEGGYEVYTTLRAEQQEAVNEVTQQGLIDYDVRHGYRGPEQRLAVPPEIEEALVINPPVTASETPEVAATLEAAPKPSSTPAAPATLTLPDIWRKELAEIPSVADLQPAIVTRVNEQSFDAFLTDGTLVTIKRDGFVWARRYINENSRGKIPPNAEYVVKPGFLIRLQQQDDETWALRQIPEIQTAMVVMSPKNGAVLALSGGFDFQRYQFNHALQAYRQPGSSFKPFIYAAGLDAGITPASIFNDAPLVFQDEILEDEYRPKNSTNSFLGPTRVREAFYRSVNLISMRILLQVGAPQALEYLKQFGFDTTNFPNNLQLALGGGTIGVTPLEMARAYTPFANGGYLVPPFFINHIKQGDHIEFTGQNPVGSCQDCEPKRVASESATDALDESVNRELSEESIADNQQKKDSQFVKAIDPRVAFQIRSFMEDVMTKGTGRRALKLERTDLAGKTGTTSSADAWFNGFSNDMIACVWVGFTNNSPIGDNEFGSTVALPIWINFMSSVLSPEDAEKQPLPPEGLVRVLVDPKTGGLADPGFPTAEFEWFRAENAPRQKKSERRSRSSATQKEKEVIDPTDIF